MIPILYDPSETAFKTNGLGILTDAIDVTVEEVLNGIFELEMQYPVKGIHFSEIIRRSIILAQPNPMTDPQPFRVYRITKPLNGIVRIYARHIAYDLQGIPVSPFSASGAALALHSLKSFAVTDCPFDFITDKSPAGTLTVSVPTSIWSLLGGQQGSVLDVFGGEYQFDRYTVNLLTRRGMDRGVSIRYGKNLTSFEQDENCANCCTGIYPYWTDTEGNLVTLPERIVHAQGNYGYVKIIPIDFSNDWDTAPTEEQIRSRAERYITDNEIGIPDVSWTVEFVALEQTEEYKGMALLERVLLGDTVHVEFPEMGVSASARAVAVKYKPLLERYEKITLGRVKSNLAETIVKQKQEIEKKPNMDALERAASIAAKAILGAKGGSVQILDTDGDGKDDTIYIADNADPALAQKVWRWNYEGWAASKTGYNGTFTMAATLEAGLLADFITAAHLTAGTIRSRDGTLFIDLDNGIIRADAITTEIAKKVDGKELSTKIQQDPSAVQIAWNNIDYRIKFESGELRIYDGQNMVAAYTMTGAKYYKSGVHVGTIGTNYSLAGNTSLSGLSFNLEPNGNFMAWIKDGAPALAWYRADSNINGQVHNAGFHAYDDFYFHDTLRFYGDSRVHSSDNGDIYIHNHTLQNRNNETNYLRWNSWDLKTHFFHPIDPAGGIIEGSDARLKENISDTEVAALDIVCAMEMKRFDRMDSGRHYDIGLIAQQLQEIAPELVGTDQDGILFLHSDKFIYYAFKAIQELAEAVKALMGFETYGRDVRKWVDNYTKEEKELAVSMYTRAKNEITGGTSA